MHREVSGLHEMALRKENPLILTSMNNLALVQSCQGKYDEVEETHRVFQTLVDWIGDLGLLRAPKITESGHL
jgi:hypothetical protein